jgi:hypothetical protein
VSATNLDEPTGKVDHCFLKAPLIFHCIRCKGEFDCHKRISPDGVEIWLMAAIADGFSKHHASCEADDEQ